MSLVKLLGVPYNVGCRTETSSALDQQNGPIAIRAALQSLMANFNINRAFDDLGDIKAKNTVDDVLKELETQIYDVMKGGNIPFVLGGAHTLTLGSLRALSRINKDFSLIYIDAHPDIMPHSTINYGSVIFYGFKEEVVRPDRTAYIGLRQVEKPEYKLLEEHNIFHVHAHEIENVGVSNLVKEIKDRFPAPYYISFDLDSLDPTFAPGVTSPYPIGLTPREVMYLLIELCRQEVLGIEIVELSPINDRNDDTARIAAEFVMRLSAVLSSRQKTH
ncbi:MAG: arginase family protein [Deltaproteobacteria bacterium]|nr:arginase family protein [Deltaproteobacteria bacterium]